MERKPRSSGNDVPIPAAMALLCVVLIFLFGWNSRDELIVKAESLAQIIEQNATAAVLVGISMTLNLVWSSLVFGRVIGLRKQGARLRQIVQDQSAKGATGKHIAMTLAYVAASFLIAWALIPETILGLQQWPFEADVQDFFYAGVCISAGMSLAIGFSILRSIRLQRIFFRKKLALSPMPKLMNGIVLGSIGEPPIEECA